MGIADFHIRTADPLADYDRIAELRNFYDTPRISAEDLRCLDADRAPGDFCSRFVAVADDEVIGAGTVVHNLWHPSGVYRLSVQVDPALTRKGYGSKLMDYAEQVAVAYGATCLEATTPDQDESGLEFLQRRGYMLVAHAFTSVLDLQSFEWTGEDAASRFPDLRFFAFSETAMDEEAKRRLWELNTDTTIDEPHNDPTHRPTFEEFSNGVIGAHWFDPTGQFFAAEGDHWIGICAIGEAREGSLYNLFTGVRRSHRGRGIAKALKVMAILEAKKRGKTEMWTSNDSRNIPMLAINASLGYQPKPGVYQARKKVEQDR